MPNKSLFLIGCLATLTASVLAPAQDSKAAADAELAARRARRHAMLVARNPAVEINYAVERRFESGTLVMATFKDPTRDPQAGPKERIFLALDKDLPASGTLSVYRGGKCRVERDEMGVYSTSPEIADVSRREDIHVR